MDSRLARRIAAIALASGIAADVLFDRTAPGINFPIAILVALVASTFVRPAGQRIDPLDWWLPPVAMLAALGVAIRTDPLVVLMDFGLAGLAAVAWALAVSIGGLTRRSVGALMVLGALAAGHVGFGSLTVLSSAAKDGSVGRSMGAGRRFFPVLRGLVIALPILALFMALLGSADAAFRHLVNEALAFPFDLDDVVRRSVLVAVVAWLAGGGLAIAAAGFPTMPGLPVPVGDAAPAAGEEARSHPAPFAIEALTVLVAVEVLFAIFVIVQVAYLFGGFATVASFGITYSQYAREGFFQLVAVVLGAGLLLAGVAAVAGRNRWFVPAALGLVALTAVILGSAAVRLSLYQQAYGWTELRFYVAAAIAWLALSLGVALALVLAHRIRFLVHGVAFAAIAVALAVTAIGPQAFITGQNVARALDPSLVPPEGKHGLDAAYVASFGDGAVPVLVDALPRLDAASRATLIPRLQARWTALEANQLSRPWPAWNLERERAREALRNLPQR